MYPAVCPEWEYSRHPQHLTVVPARVAQLLGGLVRGSVDTIATAADTREAHLHIFREVTPPGFEYYAGHYRGEAFACLQSYEVQIHGDPRVGVAATGVLFSVREFGQQVHAAISALDSNVLLTPKERLGYIVPLACRALVQFLTIHPYANGNGHAGRLIVWSILGRYGFWPRRWPVDPRPPDPPYTDLITLHRDGNYRPLEQWILQSLIA